MPKFAANLHYLFAELPFLDRFEAAAAAGFRAVEFQVPYDYPDRELKARLDANGLEMVLFDAPMGDWNGGERGLAAVPGREAEFRASLVRAADYAHAHECDLVHVMAGVVGPGTDYATCLLCSTSWATTAGSGASTALATAPWRGWAGRRSTGSGADWKHQGSAPAGRPRRTR